MKQLERDIKHLEDNLKKWHSLYDKEDLARARRIMKYLKELREKKGGDPGNVK